MNLTDLRTAVRIQTQTSSGDLPDQTIDLFLQQAFERTVNGEVQWPFYETHWDVAIEPTETSITIPANVHLAGVMALYDMTNMFRLTLIGPEFSDDHYAGKQVGTVYPLQYSIWGNTIQLFPRVSASDASRPYRLRGYRYPITWLSASNEPDCDARLHTAIIHYAVALAYAQQEDETLEATYMERWMRDAEQARQSIMEPRHHRPLVYAGSVETWPVPAVTFSVTPP